ncbi:MAG: hypothetical protein EA402_10175 [Planctomycetota bacterium]|nr:MAG: hypothetical protein EA402_10175 [Planctomycetota bacterium]
MKLLPPLLALAALPLLLGCGSSSSPTPQPSTATAPAQRHLSPEQLYLQCRACHGADGLGVSGINPPLQGSPYLDHDELMVPIILHGYRSGQWNGVMTGFAGRYSDEEMARLLNWMRQRWSPTAADTDAATVRRIRLSLGNRRAQWRPDELRERLSALSAEPEAKEP